MKSKQKKKILKMLAGNLSMFQPEHKDCFMCPTCMKVIPIKNLGEISEAHVIPKAAGGHLKTFICTKCNNDFGSKQDKWFGEIINMANSPKPSIFSSNIKGRYFEVDGTRVNGTWHHNHADGIALEIHEDRNSPQVLEGIGKKFSTSPPKITVSIPFPVLENQNLVNVGFLTAAYLMWFGLLGYSWALQDHLEIIRKQIINPGKKIIASPFIAIAKSVNWSPWIGIATIGGDTIPVFGLKQFLVLLPPRDKPNYYDSLSLFDSQIESKDLNPLQLPSKPQYGPPISIAFENRLVIHAAPSKKANKYSQTFLFKNGTDEISLLRPVAKETFDKLKKEKNVNYVNVKIPDYKSHSG